jgi:hypothetical protein
MRNAAQGALIAAQATTLVLQNGLDDCWPGIPISLATASTETARGEWQK